MMKLVKVMLWPPPSTSLPSIVSQALKQLEWCATMSNEFNAFLSNDTWTLVLSKSSQNLVGYKWVFCVKWHFNGSIECYKAQLVKAFTKGPTLTTMRLLVPPSNWPPFASSLALRCLMHGWSLKQMDVNNVFLHGHFAETISMS